MFDPSFLICDACFNIYMHNLYHSLYDYATSFFLKQLRFTLPVSLILISVLAFYSFSIACACTSLLREVYAVFAKIHEY